jgi:Ni,Fe-hydrogenase III small subunit
MVWRRVLRTLRDGPASEPAARLGEDAVRALAGQLDAAAQTRLGRSLTIRHVNSGSCNGCELEVHALHNIVYDLERFGLRFVTSPRHADVLLVTGPLTRNLREALLHAWNATPEPKWVVAIGDCAVDGGVFRGSYAIEAGPGGAQAGGTHTGATGVAAAVPVDLKIPGCPPTPAQLLNGLRALLEANAR